MMRLLAILLLLSTVSSAQQQPLPKQTTITIPAANLVRPNDVIQRKGAIWVPRTLEQLKADLGQLPSTAFDTTTIYENINRKSDSNHTHLISYIIGLPEILDSKVTIQDGKQLSSEDFTSALLAKLNAIEPGATLNSPDAALRDRTTHTGMQPAGTITEDANHRFVSDLEKNAYGLKLGAADTISLSNRINGKASQSALVDTATNIRLAIESSVSTVDTTSLSNRINTKQPTLVSGTTIKTVKFQSLLAAGDLPLPTGIDPRHFGATSGGDIGAVINSIIAATASPVYISIPEGTWNISTTPELPTNGTKTVIIRGASRDRSILNVTGAMESVISKDTGTDTRSHVIENLTIACNRLANWGLKLDGAINAKVDVRVTSPLIGGLQISGHAYESDISLVVENYSALIDTSQRPDYGLYIAPGSTDMRIRHVIAYNVRKTGVYDDGAANTYDYVHTYGSPQPLFNPLYAMDVRNGAQIKWLYSDGVKLAPAHIRGSNVTFLGGKFFWQYVRLTAGSGSTATSVNIASISGSTPTIPSGTVLNFGGNSVTTTADVVPVSGSFSIPVASGGAAVVNGNAVTFKTCPASTVSTFEIESGLTNLVLMPPTIEGDNGNSTQRQIGTAPTLSTMLQNRSDRTGFTALDLLRVKQGNSSAGAALQVESNTGTQALVSFQSNNGSPRWTLGKNGVAESGSNAGADFQVNRHDDAGAYVDAPLTVTRSSGNTNILYSAFVNDSIYNSKLTNRLSYLQGLLTPLPDLVASKSDTAHTHPISKVTSLQDSLSKKQDTGTYANRKIVSNVQRAWTGNTTETEVFRDTIKAGFMKANSSIHVPLLLSWTNSANVKTFRLKLNGTTVMQYAPSTNAAASFYYMISNRNSLTSQISGGTGGSSVSTGFGFANAGPLGTYSFNTENDLILTATVQLNNGAETMALERLEAIIYR